MTEAHLVAASLAAGGRPLVLKDGETFAVFGQAGEIRPDGLGEEGWYHDGTRFLSGLTLALEGHRLLYLDSSVGAAGQIMKAALTNPALVTGAGNPIALATLHVSVWTFVWDARLYQRVVVTNYGAQDLCAELTWTFGTDYADIFEVLEPRHSARGQYLQAEVTSDQVTLGYRGRDDVQRQTRLTFEPLPSVLTTSSARQAMSLAPQVSTTFDVTVACLRSELTQRVPYLNALNAATEARSRRVSGQCRVETSDSQTASWIDRAVTDPQMLTTETTFGPYPYAGVESADAGHIHVEQDQVESLIAELLERAIATLRTSTSYP